MSTETTTKVYRASQSFTEGEVKLLSSIFEGLLQRQPPDARKVSSSPDFPKLAQKIIRMRQRFAEEKNKNEEGE